MQDTNIPAQSPITAEVIDHLYSYTNILPVKANKKPMVEEWAHWQTERQHITDINSMPWDRTHGIAMIMGFNDFECIDIDLKNDPEGGIVKDFLSKLREFNPTFLKKIYCETTPTGGLHLIYKCPAVGASRVLARNKKGDPIIETKGMGGYAIVAPTPGYQPYKIV